MGWLHRAGWIGDGQARGINRNTALECGNEPITGRWYAQRDGVEHTLIEENLDANHYCVFNGASIGIGLVVFATQSPFKSLAPLANDILCIIGIVVFIILSFFAVTCGSANAQTKLILIIMISIFLGLSCGFLVALNVTVKSRAPLYNSNFDPF